MTKPRIQRRLDAILSTDVVGALRTIGVDEGGDLGDAADALARCAEPRRCAGPGAGGQGDGRRGAGRVCKRHSEGARQDAALFMAGNPRFTINHWASATQFRDAATMAHFVAGHRLAELPDKAGCTSSGEA